MAYHAGVGRTVLFSGWNGSGLGYLQDTWTYDGEQWSQASAAGPAARMWHQLVFDAARGEVVMFGGYANTAGVQNDTWTFDGSTWVQISVIGPSARRGHMMAFDPVRQTVLLFGGEGVVVPSRLADMWQWDGSTWSQLVQPNPRPAGRAFGALAPCGTAGLVLFGGSTLAGASTETWSWDGAAWSQRLVAGPPVRSSFAMVGQANGEVLLFGGSDSGVRLRDTWIWDGTAWREETFVIRPSSRSGHAMAYDASRRRSLLFAGHLRSDSWEFDSEYLAAATIYGAGCGQPALQLLPDATARPIVGATARVDLQPAPPTAFVALGWSRTSRSGLGFLPYSLAPFGMPGCDLWTSADTPAQPVTPVGAGTARCDVTVPNLPALAGIEINLQAWGFDANANAAGIVVSNGVFLRVGLF
jgi:hypothetical protein